MQFFFKKIRNGQKVTVTKKTTTKPDGTTHTEVQEQMEDSRGNKTNNKYIPSGGPDNRRLK